MSSSPVNPEQQASPVQEAAGNSVTLCQDGKYRWNYEFDMLRNSAILGTLFKIFGGIILGIWLVTAIVDGFENFWGTTKVMAIIFGVFVVLILVSYLIVARMYGGKYCVLFEMDEQGVNHVQLPKQFKKAQVLGAITALAGGAAGSLTGAGAGLLAATRNGLYTSFSQVRSVRSFPRQNVIKVNAPLSKNQVYVPDEDFPFVLDYIRSHCPKAR